MSLDLPLLMRRLLGGAPHRSNSENNANTAANNQRSDETRGLIDHELGQLLHYRTEFHTQSSLFQHLRHKRSAHSTGHSTSQSDQYHLTKLLPNYQHSINHFNARAFCTQFAKDGKTFVVATQDNQLHLYDTVYALCEKVDETYQPASIIQTNVQTSSQSAAPTSSRSTNQSPFQPFKQILARHVGWSIIDVDYSPNSEFVAYSTWSPYIQLCNVFGRFELHEACDMQPGFQRVCFFSIKFAPDGRSIFAGSSDGSWYSFDLEQKQRKNCVNAHSDDINSICFADETGNVICTASDDRTIRVWDIRQSVDYQPIGSFLGHSEGITCVTSADDGRLIASNGKDQCLKVWDLRSMKSASDAVEYEREPRTDYDYRYGGYRSMSLNRVSERHQNDTSIATMRGHRIAETLVRCHFSPAAATSNRYVYTGSYRGSVFIYDCLTGDVVTQLEGHDATVRDCSWHPTEPIMLTASWDNSVGLWTYSGEPVAPTEAELAERRANDPAYALFAESDDDEADEDYVEEDENDEESDQNMLEAQEGEEFDGEESDPEDDGEEEYEIDVDDDTFNQAVISMLADAMMNGIDPSQLLQRIDPDSAEEEDDEELDEDS